MEAGYRPSAHPSRQCATTESAENGAPRLPLHDRFSRIKIDEQIQIGDDMLTQRFTTVNMTPGSMVGARENMEFQPVHWLPGSLSQDSVGHGHINPCDQSVHAQGSTTITASIAVA